MSELEHYKTKVVQLSKEIADRKAEKDWGRDLVKKAIPYLPDHLKDEAFAYAYHGKAPSEVCDAP